MGERNARDVLVTVSVIIQAILAIGVWFLVSEREPTDVIASSGEAVDRPAAVTPIDLARLEQLFERLVVSLDNRPLEASPETTPNTVSPAVPSAREPVAADLAAAVADLRAVLDKLRLQHPPLAGGRIDFDALHAPPFDRDAVTRAHAELTANHEQAAPSFTLRPVTDLIRTFGRPSAISGQQDGSERWRWTVGNHALGVDLLVKSGRVVAAHPFGR